MSGNLPGDDWDQVKVSSLKRAVPFKIGFHMTNTINVLCWNSVAMTIIPMIIFSDVLSSLNPSPLDYSKPYTPSQKIPQTGNSS